MAGPPDPDPGRDEAGEPIEILARLEHRSRHDLLRRVRNAIHRRHLAAHAVELARRGPVHVVMEYLRLALDRGRGPRPRPGGSS